MLRLIATIFLLVSPGAAAALCEGRDLIAALPEAERAALEARAAAAPHAEGLLWRASRGKTRITLFGTYHFRHARTDAHLQRLMPVIAAAEAVYLEMSLDDQRAFQRQIAEDPSIMFLTEGASLPDLLGEADWRRYSEEMRKRQIPVVVASRFKPLWAAMMLGTGPCEARQGALAGRGIDALIAARAEDLGIEDRSLEHFADILTELDTDPVEKQIEMIRLTLAWPGKADDMAYTIRARYLAEQVALTWEFSRHVSLKYGGPTAQADFDRLERILLTDRNRAWVDKLLREAEGKRVLVAVGAGHLPGQAGVLNLLAQRGFAIERLPLTP